MVKEVLFFVLILLAQVLVLNHIRLFGCATPFLYVYAILMLRLDCPRWAMLLIAFSMGLVVDVFSNTMGMTIIPLTLLGFIRPYILMPFLSRETAEDMQPSIASMGTMTYLSYAMIAVFIYSLVFFTVEAFSFFNWIQWLTGIMASTVLTAMLIMVIENVRKL